MIPPPTRDSVGVYDFAINYESKQAVNGRSAEVFAILPPMNGYRQRPIDNEDRGSGRLQ
jgi:hypothetical protein